MSLNITPIADEDYYLSIDDYESDDSYYDLEWFLKFVPSLVVYSLTFFLGFFGNLLVIFSIFYFKKLQSVTNLFLVSLALADLLLIIVCVPIRMIEFFTHGWVFGRFMCVVFHYLQNFSAICSVVNLTVMSLERYFAILYPLKARYTCTKNRAQIMILGIWIFSFLAALPIIFGKDATETGKFRKVHICVRVWTSTQWIIFEIYRSTLILVIPFTIMLACYSVICFKLWKMPTKRRELTELSASSHGSHSLIKVSKSESMEMSNGSTKIKLGNQITTKIPNRADDESTRKQIIKMLICIVLIFFICWAPITIDHLLSSLKLIPNFNSGVFWYLRILFYIMSFTNSAINPIVYAFMSKNFREAFKQLCSIYTCRGKRFHRLRTDSGSGRDGAHVRTEFVKAGSEPRSSLMLHTKKTSTSSLKNNNTSIKDLQNV